MNPLLKAQSLAALVAYCALGLALGGATQAQAAKHPTSLPALGADASRMVFKESKKNKKEPTCQLTLMHVYTSKYNKKFMQFAFTGSLVVKREAGKPLVASVIGQNHQLTPSGKGVQLFPLSRIELGVEDASVRRYVEHKKKCKKGHICAEYQDTKKHELQTWIADDKKNLSLLFPLVTKQSAVVIDLSKFTPSGDETATPLSRFKYCTANLR